MGLFGGSTSTNAKTEGYTRPYLASQGRLQNNIFNMAQQLYNQTPKDAYTGDLVAPMSGATGQSLGMLQGLAGQDFGGQQISDFASQLLSGQFLDPNSNPYFKATVDAATRPILQNLREQQLPALTSQAVQSGAYGGTRNAVAQGIASRGASQAIGDTTANLSNQIYEGERARQMAAPQMFAQAAGLKTLPAQFMGQVGSTLENYQNQQLGQAYQRYLMQQQAPWIGFQNLMGPAFQNAGTYTKGKNMGGATATPSTGSIIGGGLQGAAGGALMGTQLGGPGWGTGIGAILGGLGGLFGGQ
jgi:hypothetical protein